MAAVRYFYRHDGFFLAAGLSFYVVVCILPCVLLLVAGSAFLMADETALQQILDRMAALVPVYEAEIEAALRGVVDARGVSSVVGTLILLLFASQLFAATRLVLNRIFQRHGRGLVHGLLYDLLMMLLLGVLFLATIGITAALGWVRALADLSGLGAAARVVFHWGGIFLVLLFDVALFAVIYRYVPTTRVDWPSVLTGSLAASLLWEAAKQLFRVYIESIGIYSAVYGSLGVAIALMMWVYYSSLVFVFGAALIRTLEERGGTQAF